ncbi:hypothetical protein FVA81_02780 (plasmid) [Rhizobium sp. WL3]|uniref:hypothetical protein n=1 Tax=Rhizobium sp. WL3 TaxID=2603277 RepID=UPI0011C1DCC3|nr:hypothetical protein [Rhizobium sp. WL3]QEE43574.1 hypothetical protein FVA81_02780 [Rhizobium sp. WL3]
MAFIKLEGTASKIRTDTSVSGSISRGKGSVSSTTTMNFLLDGKAVYAQFGESMSINEGDRVIVAGAQKSNGLNALAYNNLTNGTYGEGGRLARLVGYALIGLGIVLGLLVLPLLLIPIGIWVWWTGQRAKNALAICRQVTTAEAAVPSTL